VEVLQNIYEKAIQTHPKSSLNTSQDGGILQGKLRESLIQQWYLEQANIILGHMQGVDLQSLSIILGRPVYFQYKKLKMDASSGSGTFSFERMNMQDLPASSWPDGLRDLPRARE